MWDKVKKLESDPELYKEIYDALQNEVSDVFYKGDHIYNKVNESMKHYMGFDLDEK